MRQIPLEIKAAVIDELVPSEESLSDPFSNVALAWPDVLFRIRERRFHSVVIDTRKRLVSFLKLVNSTPPIALAVSKIIICDPLTNQDIDVLKQLCALLVNVSALSCGFPMEKTNVAEALRVLPSTVTDIVLSYAGIWTAQEVLDVLSLFRRMETLEIDTHGSCPGKYHGRFCCPALRYLALSDGGDLLHHFSANLEFPCISSLCLLFCRIAPPILAILNRASKVWERSLKEINLRDVWSDNFDDVDAFIFLPANLEILRLDIEVKDHSLVNLVIRTLERCVSSGSPFPNTASFHFKFQGVHPNCILNDPDIHRLDAVIGSEALGLRNLEWRYYEEEEFECTQQAFVDTRARFMTEEGRNKYGTKFCENQMSRY
ncbi:hypothetical protein CYLTODRAFT_486248 [Cylindrobasidium torrendii FP15055 ss-10]|uniref:F-box domain-containing protein n=1 Tax=Cylindrobasidium torrendii FP15055 ss-10 TaxID=1314674 RepID=A0A0D7BQ77_9AGAR|nr:hypothetical protein CYLTODRAFT_486248 [Cylindrobasidium torrendii FP15055 ss-10]